VKQLLGGGGLLSTASDYYKFAAMMMNKGRVGNNYLLSPKTIDLMTANHIPGDLNSFCAYQMGGMTPVGGGYGLGFAVLIDPVKAGVIGTAGEYHWSGGGHTSFFVDPKEELFGMILTQIFPAGAYSINKQFRTAVMQSIIESNV
jgi:CubicO group peptidase (beta-lactamase class C family)